MAQQQTQLPTHLLLEIANNEELRQDNELVNTDVLYVSRNLLAERFNGYVYGAEGVLQKNIDGNPALNIAELPANTIKELIDKVEHSLYEKNDDLVVFSLVDIQKIKQLQGEKANPIHVSELNILLTEQDVVNKYETKLVEKDEEIEALKAQLAALQANNKTTKKEPTQ